MSDIITSNSGNIAEETPVNASVGTQSASTREESQATQKKLGVALVGLGSYSTKQLAPALRETSYCHLTAVVSGSVEKREGWRVEHELKAENLYSYERFDEISANTDIDIVYVVLPNAMHAEYVIRAAQAGKHVICEKPMATNAQDCQRMIEVCRKAGVRLSIGYRLHFDPFNQEMMRLGQNKVFGPIRRIVADNSMEVGDKNQWRLDAALAGGGPLMDVGIYCIQGVIYTAGELPVSVSAKFHDKSDKDKFREVEEGIEWELTFRDGTKALCTCSYSRDADILRAEAESGWFELQPAYAYSGLKGQTSEGAMKVRPINQQAAQMDDFARCIQNNVDTRVPGEMGLRDVVIMQAIYESARTGKQVDLHMETFAQGWWSFRS